MRLPVCEVACLGVIQNFLPTRPGQLYVTLSFVLAESYSYDIEEGKVRQVKSSRTKGRQLASAEPPGRVSVRCHEGMLRANKKSGEGISEE